MGGNLDDAPFAQETRRVLKSIAEGSRLTGAVESSHRLGQTVSELASVFSLQGVGHSKHVRYNEGMSTAITREEFQAELRAMRSDMAASQAELRSAFAESRQSTTEAIAGIQRAAADTHRAVASLAGEVKGLHGGIAGVKSALTTTQWAVGLVVALSALMVAGVQLFVAYKAPPTPTPPAVIYVQPAPAIEARPSAQQ